MRPAAVVSPQAGRLEPRSGEFRPEAPQPALMRAGVHDRVQARRPEQLGRRPGLQHRRRQHLSRDDAVAARWHAAAARLYCRHADRRERHLDPANRPGASLPRPITSSQTEETNTARLPSITSKDQVAAKDRETFDSIVASRGAVQGPFTMFLHSPEVAGRVADLGAYVRFEGSLDMKVRVLAAMTVAREFEAMYVWGAQTGGARRLGVPEPTITAIRENHSRGIPPEDAEIVDFTRQLLRKHRVDDASFKAMQARFS